MGLVIMVRFLGVEVGIEKSVKNEESFVEKAVSGTYSYVDTIPSQSITPPPISHRPIRLKEQLQTLDKESNPSPYNSL